MPELAQPGDPLITQRGEIVRAERDRAGVLGPPDIRTIVPTKQRAMRDFFADAQTQSVVNVVMVYSLLGMSENEIAHTINTDIQQIQQLKRLPAYQETFAALFTEFIRANSSSLQARLQSYANNAIENMMDLADYKPLLDEDGNPTGYVVPPIVKQKANADILDRAGLSPDVLFNQGKESEDTSLQVVVTTSKDNRSDIKVDLNVKRR